MAKLDSPISFRPILSYLTLQPLVRNCKQDRRNEWWMGALLCSGCSYSCPFTSTVPTIATGLFYLFYLIEIKAFSSRLRLAKTGGYVPPPLKGINSYAIPIPTYLFHNNITWITQLLYHTRKQPLTASMISEAEKSYVRTLVYMLLTFCNISYT